MGDRAEKSSVSTTSAPFSINVAKISESAPPCFLIRSSLCLSRNSGVIR
jgi:hypothetical protein